ncbi:Uncharacterized protein AArcCO_0509 [Halalkaliarchaeum sp. AArc-CO]|uniref:DUF5787 family protein n=1 Tax=Halalkaliarchaeum sp. AArc-CO TaxID=2866381 RepID=UPI00217DE267|nr:DUF5787 family protein [Halalkaliarchaeum sp. AArc-CO]UWG49832.1 Uncharacterized protein AArcCO_0509 [Halalkaliarchaeum sp. AArc-CO]
MSSSGGEFAFELRVCRWAELAWAPAGSNAASDVPRVAVVARQLGTRKRRWDTVIVEADPAGLRERAAFGSRELDSDLLFVLRNAPADWMWYRDALPDPGYPWRYVRETIHRASARDLLETRRNGNRIRIKRIAPYPDWVRRLVAIENKPDLDASAARALAGQLQHDVDRGLADEVWLATATTGGRVERALLADFPVEAGVLAFDFSAGVRPEAASVEWLPSRLDAGNPSENGDRPEDRKRRRLELAERAFGRGWRSYHRTMRPDCRAFELRRDGRLLSPWCTAKERKQTAAECSGNCQAFSPEPPAWRTRGWPIDGGPGKGITRLLQKRRERARSGGRDGT